jgi:NADPH-dependent 2,4-dienoyl-CoA reductase/sulfur reductase-like enzyme
MSGSGVDMERGILVDGRLKSSIDGIWAAGDVCQIWSPALNGYRFYYGYRNVRRMGEIAARNMSGETADFEEQGDESLQISDDGLLYSPLWEHD